MSKLKNATARTMKFVSDHKVAIAVTATATATAAICLTLNKRNIDLTNDFLREHGLYEKFWDTTEM